MNTNSISKIIPICFAVLILYSCESHVKKADDDFSLYKENKMQSQETISTTKEITQAPKKIDQEPKRADQVRKNESPDEWTLFKRVTDKRIQANEKKIEALRNNPTENAKVLKKVSALEKDNNNLRSQMDEYNEKMKVSFDKFKTTINHDVDEIDIKLKDIDTKITK
jgi:hypothetical protein